MNLLRHQFVIRIVSFTLVITALQAALIPNYVWAITVGPYQPEYTAYEEAGGTDMVNLATGDFTMSLPILEVPGPEGGFSLPLSYYAGISPQQEASWVGLGWSLNAGALSRTINAFPDDANGEGQSVTVQDLTGLRGWDANVLGVGRFGWNNQQGHYGQLSLLSILNASWTEDFSSVGIAGINVTSNGMAVDPLQMSLALISIASMGSAGAAAKSGETAFQAIAKSEAIGLAINAGMDAMTSMSGNTPTPGGGYWAYNKTEKKNWLLKVATGGLVNVNEYKIWLDKTRVENMFGLLYLGNAPTTNYTNTGANADLALKNGGVSETLKQFLFSTQTTNRGASSDINYQPDVNESLKQFYEVNNPVFLAKDKFSVKAPGISGSISPYRLEAGSVAMPREMTPKHVRLAPVPYLTNDAAYKVPFIYDGQLSNSYFHHLGGTASPTIPAFYFGITTPSTSITGLGSNKKLLTYELNDVALKSLRIRSDLASLKKIPQSNYIEWLTQNDIKNTVTYPSKFMDFLSGGAGPAISTTSDRYLFRNYLPVGKIAVYASTTSFAANNIQLTTTEAASIAINDLVDIQLSLYTSSQNLNDGTTNSIAEIQGVSVSAVNYSTGIVQLNPGDSRLYPFNGQLANIQLTVNKSPQSPTTIGGFCITSADGNTYHFALPIYEYDNHSEIREKSDPNNKKSIIHRSAPFANTWLLTGITGSDFIDRNTNGVIDESDWGHWVKFNYGNHMNNYQWREPYSGYTNLKGDTQESYSEGKNQLIYLNSIETRSHVALFLKNYRTDGKSANTVVSQYPLRLEEIALVKREHYKKLVAVPAQGGFGQPEISNSLNTTLYTSTYSPAALDFIKKNCLKRIKFQYTYDLAVGAPNSSAGKLTLTRISLIGQNDVKLVPDYKFEYANNPIYTSDDWDGWGLFNPAADATSSSHQVSSDDTHGTAWSLTSITNPLGGKIEISYERDSYSSVSGYNTETISGSYSNPNHTVYFPTAAINRLTVPNASNYSAGDLIKLQGLTSFYCPNNQNVQIKNFTGQQYYTIQSVGSNYIDLGMDFNGYGTVCGTSSGTMITVESQYGTIYKYTTGRKGGDIRVGSISFTNDFGSTRKLRYKYLKEDGSSSGVVAQEPDLINTNYTYFFNDLPGYPQTSVIYGRTSVLSGNLSNDYDYHTEDVYEFETPHFSQYTLTKNIVNNNSLISSNNYNSDVYLDFLTVFENKVEDRTAIIGKLKSTKKRDAAGTVISSSSITYDDDLLNNGVNNYQGVYGESAIMVDRISLSQYEKSHKLNKTSTIQYPYVVKKVVNSKDGMTSESENLSWDLLTGAVLQKLDKSSLGIYVKTINVPAYTKYPELSDKTSNVANKNILNEIVASYSFKSNAAGASLGLFAASVQTWKKDWANYRIYNSGTQTFSDGTEDAQVWRKNASYIFKGNYLKLQADGTLSFIAADEYNFTTGASNPLWQYVGESERFDHFSMPLQRKDVNGIYSSVKMSYDNQSKIAEASNAKFTEIAFTSAEDVRSDIPFFGSEIAIGIGGNATIVYKSKGQTTEVHTGDAALSLSTGYGFVYKPTGLSLNRNYRASVWTNSTNGRIYYKLNGSGEVLSAAPLVTQKAGNWYLLHFEIPISTTFTSLEVGVKSNGGSVLFDDFRFQPLDASMVCYVFNPLSYEFTTSFLSYDYVLDNENMYTKYEFNERGFLTKTFRESFKANGEKLVSEYKENFKRFSTNQ